MAPGSRWWLVVDTTGLLLAVAVTKADVDGTWAAPAVLGRLTWAEFPRLRRCG